ncbi:ROK family protein [Bacillus sp. JJ1533]|uniref:ROK family protein n=1 Tax=Bacillus sp. JJ1533 TaxID=3122959 RepID=UPI002FFEC25A
MKKVLAGFDIGGTKCAVVLGEEGQDQTIQVLERRAFPTPTNPHDAINKLMNELSSMIEEKKLSLESIGISCGGPLDSIRGLILSPPNLPNWDHIDIFTPIKENFNVPVAMQNDANACALAEWQWGAGVGCQNLVFLTFGTGMGAGLILNGQLYSGTNDMAGEVGHIRLEDDGPVGFGKEGSFEGFCSGGGIARLAQTMVKEQLEAGNSTIICSDVHELEKVTAKSVAEAALQGDELAIEIYRIVGTKLGKGISILLDILNPEKVIIGSIYARQEGLLRYFMLEEINKEALPHTIQACSIEPAKLQESVGDLASLSVAKYALNGEEF